MQDLLKESNETRLEAAIASLMDKPQEAAA